MKTTLKKTCQAISIIAGALIFIFSGCQNTEQPKTTSEGILQNTTKTDIIFSSAEKETEYQPYDTQPSSETDTEAADGNTQSYNLSTPGISSSVKPSVGENTSFPTVHENNGTTANVSSGTKMLLWPVPGVKTITSDYHIDDGRNHPYINIGGSDAYGTTVIAVSDGTVSVVSTDDNKLGRYIKIAHSDGISTVYATLGKVKVIQGQSVKTGDEIAEIGISGASTGANLHFEILKNNTPVNPHLYFSN